MSNSSSLGRESGYGQCYLLGCLKGIFCYYVLCSGSGGGIGKSNSGAVEVRKGNGNKPSSLKGDFYRGVSNTIMRKLTRLCSD